MRYCSSCLNVRVKTFRQATLYSVVLLALVLAFPIDAPGQQNAKSNNRTGASRIGATLKKPNGVQKAPSAPTKGQTPARTSGIPQKGARPVTAPNAPRPNQTPQAQAPQQESCSLMASHLKGSADVVEVALEGSGDIIQTNLSGKTERVAIEMVAGFKYEERFEENLPNGAALSIRQYEQAGMKRKLGASVTRPLLDSSRKHIVSKFDGKKTTIYAPVGPMKSEQYALINELPFNTTLLDRLLPNRQVKLGDDWQISTDVLAAMLGVEAIETNTFYLTLTSIVDNFAEVEIYLQGKKDAKGVEGPSTLECASEGASVALDLGGKFQYDLTSKRITWFGLNINERRSESVAAPGLECSATLKINIAPLEEPEKLTNDVVEKLLKAPTPEQLALYYNAQKGPWKFRHSRRWKMIEDADKSTALCYVDKGEAIAQCNILSNGKIDLSTKPSLDSYKEEIKKGLDDRFSEFKQEAVYEGENETSTYFVVADGVYDSIPFRWIYYLVTDAEGNQATIMFEIRADLLDKYDESGTEIVDSFRMVPKTSLGLQATLEKSEPKSKGIDSAPSPEPKKK